MRRMMSLLLCAVLLSSLCACGGGGTEGEFQLWFLSRTGQERRTMASQSYRGEQSVPAVMAALLSGPAEGGRMESPIPEGTELLGWTRSGRVLSVDLSGEYASLHGVDLTMADSCIALTLLQLEGVEQVAITVQGANLPERAKPVLNRDDFFFSGAEEEPVELTAALCFRRAGGDELGVELRVFRLIGSESATEAVLRALAAGPRESGLTVLLPPETEVYSARVEDGVCYADFSAAFAGQTPESEKEQELVVRSVVESLCSLGYVRGVQILVEGETLDSYGSYPLQGVMTPEET
ncbi:MAG: GerMN domain-containing protein [Oscillospiraceae bacterium]|nr:GerMN domain-containing protein [Oscillospiraceae bacterium]